MHLLHLNKIWIIIFLLSCNENITNINFDKSKSSEESYLFSDESNIYMSWIETDSANNYLYYSKLENNQWLEKKLIVKGKDWFVNWADFPSIAVNSKTNNMIAHYLKKSYDLTFAYDIKYLIKGDEWSEEKFLNTDNTKSEHGFVSIKPFKDGFITSWLDGRKTNYLDKELNNNHESGGPMTLRSAFIDSNGKIIEEYEVDDQVCECCQTSITVSNNTPIIVYRDRSDDEIRDISISKLINNVWSKPKKLNEDNWKIYGCPVNGPSIDSNDKYIAIAWFTLSNGEPTINLKFSNDNGESFGNLIKINNEETRPLGRIDLEMLKNGSVIVSWIDTNKGVGKISLRKIDPNGNKSEIINPSNISTKRISGFPQIENINDDIILSFTKEEKGKKNIETFKIPISLF